MWGHAREPSGTACCWPRCILITISIGGLVEIVPLFTIESTIEGSRACAPTRRSSSPAATSTSARAATSATPR